MASVEQLAKELLDYKEELDQRAFDSAEWICIGGDHLQLKFLVMMLSKLPPPKMFFLKLLNLAKPRYLLIVQARFRRIV